MLVQFSVENVLSFDEEQVFSMVAGSGDQHPTHLVPGMPRKGEALVRAAALYGANGAGKSNLVQAIQFAQHLITRGTRGSQPIPFRPFRLGGDSGRPSKLEFHFVAQNVLYNYGFRIDAARVHEEWLFATPKGHEVAYFQRSLLPGGSEHVELGPALAGRTKRQRQFLEFIAQGTRPNQLFLTEAIERNVDALMPVADWFKENLVVISAEDVSLNAENRAHTDTEFVGFLSRFLSAADTGIETVTTEEVPVDLDRFFPALPEANRAEIRAVVAQMPADHMALAQGLGGHRYAFKRGLEGEPVLVRFSMQHRGKDGRRIPFEIHEESEGTQRLVHLTTAVFSLRADRERVVIIDELDRRLHPLVARLLIETALSGGGRSQLVFTTHDTNLLDLDLLRRDEVWFVEKDKGGASHLYSLAEFRIRPDLKIEKGYLNGRFGAIPFIGDLHRLGLTDESEPETAETSRYALSGAGADA